MHLRFFWHEARKDRVLLGAIALPPPLVAPLVALLLSPVAAASPSNSLKETASDSNEKQQEESSESPEAEALELDLEPEILEGSPTLQRWLEETPDILEDIRTDPAFRTRLRAGYSEIEDESGFHLGVEDVFLGDTGLTLSADYQSVFEGDRQSWGVDLRYYTLPLGSRVNIAPHVGYREVEVPDDQFDGAEVGLRLLLVPSRTAAADLSVTQSWVNPGSDRQEISVTTFMAGYAFTSNLRLSTDIQIQVTPEGDDHRFGIGLELLL